jgi:radical SAM protein with 4Fe4S-binding SPASM domain
VYPFHEIWIPEWRFGTLIECKAPWESILVRLSGNVFNCCFQKEAVGNLYRSELSEIWNGAKMKEIRAALLAGKFPDVCLGEMLCPFRRRRQKKEGEC